jgi:hypothetical protein
MNNSTPSQLTPDVKIGMISGIISAIVSGIGSAIITGIWTSDISKNNIKEERFMNAAELIGHENANVRSAGVVVMGQVMDDLPEKQWKIVEILAGVIRINSENRKKGNDTKIADPEVRMAINVLKKRDFNKDNQDGKKGNEPRIVNLTDAFLVGTDFQHADLPHTSFDRSNLTDVSFLNAELPTSFFRGTNLSGADLGGANLDNAKLKDAILENADLEGTKLHGADFTETQIKKACNWHLAQYDNKALKMLKLDSTTSKLREKRLGCKDVKD